MATAKRSDLKDGAVFYLQNVAGGSVLDLDVGRKEVQGWALRNTKNQLWQWQSQGSESFMLKNVATGLFLVTTGVYRGATLKVSSNGSTWKVVNGSRPDSFKLELLSNPEWMVCLMKGEGSNGETIYITQFASYFDRLMSWELKFAEDSERPKEELVPNGDSKELDLLKSRLQKSQNEAASEKKEKDEAKKKLDETSKHFDDLKRQLEEANQQLEQAKAMEKSLRAQEEQVKNQSDDLVRQSNEARTAQEQSQQDQKELEKELGEVKKRWADHKCDTSKDQMQNSYAQVKDENVKLIERLKHAQSELDRLTSKRPMTDAAFGHRSSRWNSTHSDFCLSAHGNHEFTFLKRLASSSSRTKPPGPTNG